MRSASRHLEAIEAPSPTIILPAQFFDLSPGRHAPAGIRRLMVAILDDAICVYRNHRHAVMRDRRRLHDRARRWFESEDRAYVFSFLRITEALGIEPDLLRRALRTPGAAAVTGRVKCHVARYTLRRL
jgi:hypothetical protein